LLFISLLQHPPPTEVQEVQQQSYGGYQPSYAPSYQKPQYYQEYYNYYDQSKIERRAKVKEIKCPSYGYGYQQPKQSYGYGYTPYQDEDVCFVAVEGYDACVADKGAAIFCLVPEKYGYQAGYNNYESYQSSYGYGYTPNTYYASYPKYESSYYNNPIT
jgi:hypothetical protein